MRDTTSKSDLRDPFGPGLIALAFTFGFVVTAFVTAGLIMSALSLPRESFGAALTGLYDVTMWATLLYTWWLDRSVDPRDKQDPLMYWLFIGLSLVPWTAKGDEEPLIKAVALLMLFAAFYRATTLRQKTSCYQAG